MTASDQRFKRICLTICVLSLAFIIFSVVASRRSTASLPHANTATVVQTQISVHTGPNANYNVIGEVSAGSQVGLLARNDASDWVFVEHQDVRGWVRKSAVSPVTGEASLSIWNNPMAGAVLSVAEEIQARPAVKQTYDATVGTYALNIYTQPGIDNLVVGHLEEGNNVQMVARTAHNEWVFVQTENASGFINGKFLFSDQEIAKLPAYSESYGYAWPNLPIATVNTQFIRLRGGPSEDYSIRGYRDQGHKVTIVGKAKDRNWVMARIRFEDVWIAIDSLAMGVDVERLPIIDGNWIDPLAGEFKY